MGANSKQAVATAAFLLAFTSLSGGLYKGSMLLYLLAAVLLAVSVAAFRNCKPLEQAEN